MTSQALPLSKRIRRFFQPEGLTLCRISYSLGHHPSYSAISVLNDNTHVLYHPTKQRYDARSRDTLWWSVTSNTMNAKRVVRTWTNRRLRRAFTESLRLQGYDSDGKRIDQSAAQMDTKALKGTLEIFTKEAIITATGAEVQSQAALIVNEVIRVSSKDAKSPR